MTAVRFRHILNEEAGWDKYSLAEAEYMLGLADPLARHLVEAIQQTPRDDEAHAATQASQCLEASHSIRSRLLGQTGAGPLIKGSRPIG